MRLNSRTLLVGFCSRHHQRCVSMAIGARPYLGPHGRVARMVSLLPATHSLTQTCDGRSSVTTLCRPRTGGTKYQRLSGSLLEGTDREDEEPWTFHPVRWSWWVLSWAIPGVGMFLEGYFIFRCAAAWPQPRFPAALTTCGQLLIHLLSWSRNARRAQPDVPGGSLLSRLHAACAFFCLAMAIMAWQRCSVRRTDGYVAGCAQYR